MEVKLLEQGYASGFILGMTVWSFTYCIGKVIKFFKVIT